MAKSTAHKALAAAKVKHAAQIDNLIARLARVSTLAQTADQWRSQAGDLAYQVRQLHTVIATRDEAIAVAARQVSDLEKRVLSYGRDFSEQAAFSQKQGRTIRELQNDIAAVRNEGESRTQLAAVVGILTSVAAYAAGIAMQHWFPINF